VGGEGHAGLESARALAQEFELDARVEEGCDEGAVGGVGEVGIDHGGLDVDLELVQGRLAADGEQLGHGEEEVDDAVELLDEAVEVGQAL